MLDARVREAVAAKIDAATAGTSELREILDRLGNLPVSSRDDFAYGIAIGRIYNSFHYQTRRILKRDATKEEFSEFLEILNQSADAIRAAVRER
jgi:hypothetical protein